MSSTKGNDDVPISPLEVRGGEAQGGAVAAEEEERRQKFEMLEKKLWGREDWVHPVK